VTGGFMIRWPMSSAENNNLLHGFKAALLVLLVAVLGVPVWIRRMNPWGLVR